MKAMMSTKLRNILNDPERARKLQKELARSSQYTEKEISCKHEPLIATPSLLNTNQNFK
jgi:hypothetical protein